MFEFVMLVTSHMKRGQTKSATIPVVPLDKKLRTTQIVRSSMVFHYGRKAHSSGGGCLDGVDDRSVLMDRGKPLCMYLVSLFLAVTSSSPGLSQPA